MIKVEEPKIAIVAPYKELSVLAAEACTELNENIIIRTGDLAEGVELAKEFVNKGIEIIISRGGTARAIRASENVPVVEIAISGFDIIRALDIARKKGSRVGVVGFKNVIYGSKSLNEILGIEIFEFEIENSTEAESGILNAMAKKVDVIVGDAIAIKKAKEYDLETVLITSGKEAVSSSIREANDIAILRRKEQARTEQLKTILEFAYEGIIAVDQQGRIALMNPEAEKMLQLNKDKVVGKLASEALKEIPFFEVLSFGIMRTGELKNINGNSVAINVVPVIINNQPVGGVATIQDIKRIQDIEEKARKQKYAKGLIAHYNFNDIVTTAPIMRNTIDRAMKFSKVDSTVLINGETGTGKEMFAQGIHNYSKRKDRPFVAINCAALAESILESELFGYEGGAFTGAKKEGRKGLFELAHSGTIFLDEIAEISTSTQARLLRVLQEREIMRIGGNKVIPIDVRVIAATSKNLLNLIEKGKFRRDLYHRLSILLINIPPLRERIVDIPVLLRVLCRDLSKQLKIEAPNFDNEAINLMKSMPWYGNIRELRNLLEQLTVLKQGAFITATDITNALGNSIKTFHNEMDLIKKETYLPNTTLEELELETIKNVLKSSKTRKEAAEKLGISTTTLWRKMKRFQSETKDS